MKMFAPKQQQAIGSRLESAWLEIRTRETPLKSARGKVKGLDNARYVPVREQSYAWVSSSTIQHCRGLATKPPSQSNRPNSQPPKSLV
jgi:hypothetical protein